MLRGEIEAGKIPGAVALVARKGQIVYFEAFGVRDKSTGEAMPKDTIFRIYSMTKPITSVAAMMLYEEGAFELKDPVERWIPAFGQPRVWRGGSALKPVTEPLAEPVRVWHLLTHTAGLSYGFQHAHPVDGLYREAGFEWGTPPGLDLAGCCEAWAALPLLFQPGTEWNYSVATDVLGHVVEGLTGSRSTASSTSASSRRSGWSTPAFTWRTSARTAWRRCTCRIRPPAAPPASTRSA